MCVSFYVSVYADPVPFAFLSTRLVKVVSCTSVGLAEAAWMVFPWHLMAASSVQEGAGAQIQSIAKQEMHVGPGCGHA